MFCMDPKFSTVPQVRFKEEKAMNQAMLTINQAGLTEAVHDISQGGLWQALIEMVAGDRNWPFVGVDISCPEGVEELTFLFSENGGFLCEVLPENFEECQGIWKSHGVDAHSIGFTTNGDKVIVNGKMHKTVKLAMRVRQSAFLIVHF